MLGSALPHVFSFSQYNKMGLFIYFADRNGGAEGLSDLLSLIASEGRR